MTTLRKMITPLPAAALIALVLTSCGGEPPGSLRASITELPLSGQASREWPRLARDGGRVTLSWLEEEEGDTVALRFAFVEPSGPGQPRTVVRSDGFFRNWADFPSVVPAGDSLLLAHWLLRGPTGGYDYGVRVAASSDEGRSWSEPRIPHGDDTPTEHGFVTLFPMGAGDWGMVWLDGRNFARVEDEEEARMSIRFRRVGADGFPGPEAPLDLSTCDCCQTDAALTSLGPVVVYRDRSPGEIRDISLVRWIEGGWTEPRPVHEDGWVMPACPVNGPGVAARDSLVAVAWFTGARDEPTVKVAFSRDAGATFGHPIQVDEGNPTGRVDVKLLESREAVVTWIEGVGPSAELRIRRVGAGGGLGASHVVASSSGERAGGFPRMVLAPWGDLLLTWTVPEGPDIRVVALSPGDLDPSSGS